MSKLRSLLPAMAVLAACSPGGNAVAQDSETGDARPFTASPVADFEAPWAMTFLPDGRMLVTEKAGQMLLLSADAGERSVVSGTPAVSSAGQGALMDVV